VELNFKQKFFSEIKNFLSDRAKNQSYSEFLKEQKLSHDLQLFVKKSMRSSVREIEKAYKENSI